MPTSSTSPQVFTPSQASVVALHAGASPPSTPSTNTRSRSGSFVPLQRIEYVRVAKKLRRDGRWVYVASVFLQRNEARRRLSEGVYKVSPASKLSPEAVRAFMMAEREPDYSVEHPFSEFRQLRDSAVMLAKGNKTHLKTCTGCQELLRGVANPKHQNWTVKRLFGNKEQRFALLTTFVNDLLKLAAGNVSVDAGEKDCQVREEVGKLVQEFFKREYRQSLGII
ncbi:hypothetical protein P3T76_012559 [Phytophthora citrophthora]|uniref:Uncharacterized protein n=1 Tax=Phytophthora citrophthora TaxID=4793 RepID=A0AAD9G4S7_9STRA|nr:hypothetical protein P3T76_012559 [Phytophthora citrophthora]